MGRDMGLHFGKALRRKVVMRNGLYRSLYLHFLMKADVALAPQTRIHKLSSLTAALTSSPTTVTEDNHARMPNTLASHQASSAGSSTVHRRSGPVRSERESSRRGVGVGVGVGTTSPAQAQQQQHPPQQQHQQLLPTAPHYAVYIRLPFPRNGFVDPARVCPCPDVRR